MPHDGLYTTSSPFTGYAVFFAIHLLALTVRHPSILRPSFFAVLLAITYILISYTTARDSVQDYGTSTGLLTQLFFASDYLLLTDVHNELRIVGQSASISEASFAQRFKWALKLLSSPRGVGWTHEPTCILPQRPSPTLSHARFAVTQTSWAALKFLVYDACCFLSSQTQSFGGHSPGLGADGWMWRCWNVMVLGLIFSCWIDMNYCLFTALAVMTRTSSPSDWPPIFGPLTETYTVRRFWGRTWQQSLRRFFLSHGRFVAYQLLKLKPDSLVASLVQLYVAFFISGIIHQVGDYSMHRTSVFSDGTSILFFLLQATAIVLEYGVIATAKKMGFGEHKMFGRIVGFAWVGLWFTACVPIWADPMIRAGILNPSLKFSPARGMSSGQWILDG